MQHHLGHFLCLGRIGLEERAGANAECLAGKFLFHGIGAYIEANGCQLLYDLWPGMRLDKHLAGGGTTAYQYLGPFIGYLTQNAQGCINLFVGDRTGREGQYTMRAPGSQARLSTAVHGEAHVVAIVPRVIARQRF